VFVNGLVLAVHALPACVIMGIGWLPQVLPASQRLRLDTHQVFEFVENLLLQITCETSAALQPGSAPVTVVVDGVRTAKACCFTFDRDYTPRESR